MNADLAALFARHLCVQRANFYVFRSVCESLCKRSGSEGRELPSTQSLTSGASLEILATLATRILNSSVQFINKHKEICAGKSLSAKKEISINKVEGAKS